MREKGWGENESQHTIYCLRSVFVFSSSLKKHVSFSLTFCLSHTHRYIASRNKKMSSGNCTILPSLLSTSSLTVPPLAEVIDPKDITFTHHSSSLSMCVTNAFYDCSSTRRTSGNMYEADPPSSSILAVRDRHWYIDDRVFDEEISAGLQPTLTPTTDDVVSLLTRMVEEIQCAHSQDEKIRAVVEQVEKQINTYTVNDKRWTPLLEWIATHRASTLTLFSISPVAYKKISLLWLRLCGRSESFTSACVPLLWEPYHLNILAVVYFRAHIDYILHEQELDLFDDREDVRFTHEYMIGYMRYILPFLVNYCHAKKLSPRCLSPFVRAFLGWFSPLQLTHLSLDGTFDAIGITTTELIAAYVFQYRIFSFYPHYNCTFTSLPPPLFSITDTLSPPLPLPSSYSSYFSSSSTSSAPFPLPSRLSRDYVDDYSNRIRYYQNSTRFVLLKAMYVAAAKREYIPIWLYTTIVPESMVRVTFQLLQCSSEGHRGNVGIASQPMGQDPHLCMLDTRTMRLHSRGGRAVDIARSEMDDEKILKVPTATRDDGEETETEIECRKTPNVRIEMNVRCKVDYKTESQQVYVHFCDPPIIQEWIAPLSTPLYIAAMITQYSSWQIHIDSLP